MKRGLALLMLVLHLTGCTTWRPVTVSPSQLVEEEQPERLRIVRADGTQMVIGAPRVESDSLTALVWGRGDDGRGRAQYRDTVRIALSDVSTVAVSRFSAGRTAVAVVGIFFGVVAVSVACCFSLGHGR
jgi:glycerol-3-phosphate O-acyltransferase